MTAWLLALSTPALLAVAVLGAVDLWQRRDLGWRGRALWVSAAVVAPPAAAVAYVLTRPPAAARGLLGSAAGEVPTAGPPTVTTRRERLLRQLGRLAARGLFRSVEVVRPDDTAPGGPRLWVASHFGAFSDPIVLLHALERPPRFLAAGGLFRVPVLGWLLRAAGAIAVRRTQDGGGANVAAFGASWEALRSGDDVAIFPEGIANDTTSLAPLRTGAARIALGAAVAGLRVVPVGIHYEDKAGLRRRVFVDVGEPLELDRWLVERGRTPARDAGEPDRQLARALTDELDRRLRTVAPSFVDVAEQHALLAAADVALRGPTGRATYGRRADLADALAERPAADRARLRAAVDAYRDELDAARVDDAAVVAADRRSRRAVLAQLLVGVLLLPPAILGTVVHAPLAVLAWSSGRLRFAPATAATVRPLVAIVGALVTWIVVAWWAVRADLVDATVTAVGLALVVLPSWGLAALVIGERLLLVVSATRQRTRRAVRGGVDADVLALLLADRRRIVELVTGAPPDGPSPPAS